MMSEKHGALPYEQVLSIVQQAIASVFTGDISDATEQRLKELIEKYVIDHAIKCTTIDGLPELINYIYHDMAQLSFISRDDLFNKEGFEEININAWDDVEIISHGETVKTGYSFLSPGHAINMFSRMFQKTKTVFDDAMPRGTADIGNGIRIIAQKSPLVDADVAIVASIRRVNTDIVDKTMLLGNGTLTPFMMDFLLLCLMHGASICVSGETGSGKTTLAGCLLGIASQKLRTYTIEEGSREWNFVRRDAAGARLNSVVHTKTRPNAQDEKLNIDQEALVKDSLRFDPVIIAPGEIRGREAFEVMGVSNTGHTVITTVHSNGTADTPERIVTLAKKAFDMTDHTLFSMMCHAFPILVHIESGADRKRRVTEIREITGYLEGEIQSQMLFEFLVEDNIYAGDTCVEVKGAFTQLAGVSDALVKLMMKKGARRSEVAPYQMKGGT